MRKETNSGRHKRAFLTILQGASGNPDGLDLEWLMSAMERDTGTNSQTVRQWLKEQGGQICIKNGRIHIIPDAFLISTTSRAQRRPESPNGTGVSNRMKKWNWRTK